MARNIVKTTAKIFGGSAVAGMGLSFGRDIYKGIKRSNIIWIVLIACLLVAPFAGIVLSGIWMARNYRTIWGSIFKRLGALTVLVPCLLGMGMIFALAGAVAEYEPAAQSVVDAPKAIVIEDSKQYESYRPPRAMVVDHSVADSPTEPPRAIVINEAAPEIQAESSGEYDFRGSVWFGYFLYTACFLLGLGVLVGFVQRLQRGKVWRAEDYNEQFLVDQQLVEHEDGTLEHEPTGQTYRIDHVGKKRITLFPIGRRGKRAYLNIDENGKYEEFIGMV